MKATLSRVHKFINQNEPLFILLFIVFLLRLPSLFEPFWYGDENIYFAIGLGIKKGLVLYRDITDFPNKPPAIYLLAAITQSVFLLRLILMFWVMLGTAGFYFLSQTLTRHKRLTFLSTFVFLLATSTPIFEGNIANAEIFFIFPTIFAALFLWKAFPSKSQKPPLKLHFAAGLSIGLAFLFKIHVALDIAAFGYFFYILTRLTDLKLKTIRTTLLNKAAWTYVLGVLIPIASVLVIWSLQGVSPTDLFLNAAGSGGYVEAYSSQELLLQTIGMGSLLSRTILLAILSLALFLLRKRLKPSLLFITTWLLFALYAALLSARPYPHYLLQIIPPLTLAPFLLVGEKHKLSIAAVLLSIVLVVGGYFRFDFGAWSILPYYQNFFSYLSGSLDRTDYYRRFDYRMPRNYELAKYLRTHTDPSQPIYIWGTEPGVYVMSARLPVEKLVTSFHVDDLDYFEPTLQALRDQQTNTIVVMETEWRDFPGLQLLLDEHYLLVKAIGDPGRTDQENAGSRALIYRRISTQ